MKRTLIILCVILLAVLNVACGKSPDSPQEFASQEAFLKDMAAGITKRLNDDRSEASMSSEERREFYNDIVGYELNYIEKYTDEKFEDSAFNELAHRYIEACLAQRSAYNFYKNEELYNALWTGGRTVRSGIIVAMYEQYDLALSSTQVEEYRNSDSGAFSYSFSTDNDTYDNATPVHISAANPAPVIYNENGIKISVKSCIFNQQYYEIKFLINNNGDKNVAVSIGGLTINNFELSVSNDFGSVAPGNSGFMSIRVFRSYLEEAGLGENFDEFNCNIWLSDDGVLPQDYYVKIPSIIDRSVFTQE